MDFSQLPTVDADALKRALVAEGMIDEAGLISLLGAERDTVSLNQLETRLSRASLIGEEDLRRVKGKVSGREILDDETAAVRTDLVDADASRATGMLVLDRDEPTVAMVEDLPVNVQHAAAVLGTWDFRVLLVTAAQFTRMRAAAYRGEEVDRRPECRDLYEAFDLAMRYQASDVHLAVGRPPVLRVDGDLVEQRFKPIDAVWMERELPKVLSPDRMAVLRDRSDVDAAYTYGTARFRINAGVNERGMTLVARRLPGEIPTMEQLKLPQPIRDFTDLKRGLVLVTGPTGSGKSTTLAAMLDHINTHKAVKIITLEDPVEFRLPHGRAMVDQREMGAHVRGFSEGLRQALRQDPDVILVGEMRDKQTMRTAIEAAETGHLVFATLHTYDAPSTMARIINSFSPGERDEIRSQLSYVLAGVVSQTLLPTTGGRGRLAAFEVLIANDAARTNLRKADGLANLRQVMEQGRRVGMQTMDMALAELVYRGHVRVEAAEARARDVDDLRQQMRKLSTR